MTRNRASGFGCAPWLVGTPHENKGAAGARVARQALKFMMHKQTVGVGVVG